MDSKCSVVDCSHVQSLYQGQTVLSLYVGTKTRLPPGEEKYMCYTAVVLMQRHEKFTHDMIWLHVEQPYWPYKVV